MRIALTTLIVLAAFVGLSLTHCGIHGLLTYEPISVGASYDAVICPFEVGKRETLSCEFPAFERFKVPTRAIVEFGESSWLQEADAEESPVSCDITFRVEDEDSQVLWEGEAYGVTGRSTVLTEFPGIAKRQRLRMILHLRNVETREALPDETDARVLLVPDAVAIKHLNNADGLADDFFIAYVVIGVLVLALAGGLVWVLTRITSRVAER